METIFSAKDEPAISQARSKRRSNVLPACRFAIVLATDGASNVPSDITPTLRELRARDIPVFTIGVGDTARPLDAELTRINMPRRVLVGSRVNIETFVGLSGYSATKVLLGVREDGRAIKTEEFDLRGNDTQAINLEITPTTPGVHRYTVEITPLDGELTIDNNKQDALVEVIQGPLRLLHVEGEPRWELGKIRESLQLNEKNVVLVSLQRTGENKFYRQGIGNQVELATGFPKTEEELFSYDGLVLGSVEPVSLPPISCAVSRLLSRAAAVACSHSAAACRSMPVSTKAPRSTICCRLL